MNDLTARQIVDINTINKDMGRMDFAGLVQDLIDSVPVVGTPVNAVQADISLAVSGVVIHGESVTIDNPVVALDDVYEFVADEALSVSDPANIPVDISGGATKSTVTLTLDTQPLAGDTFTLGTKEYTFVPLGTDNFDGEVTVGADLAAAKLALVAAINGDDGHNVVHILVSCAAFATNDAVISALIGGTAGDAIVSTEAFDEATNVFDSVTLASGVDCSAADAIVALAAVTVASDTQGIVGTDGAGDTLDVDADAGGVLGNAIVIAEDMANGAFAGAAVLLVGGIDGTVGEIGGHMIDDTYLYCCVAAQTIADANWRRIAVGSVF